MKRLLLFFMLAIMLLSTNPAYSESNIKVKANGHLLKFPDQQPIMVENRILIPLRFVSEAFESTINWDEKNQTVIINSNGTEISIMVGSIYPKVNGETKTLDVPASIVGGRVMVPVRFISEAMGKLVAWDNIEQTVLIDDYSLNYLYGQSYDFKFLFRSGYTNDQIIRALATSAIYDRLNKIPYDTFLLDTFPEEYVTNLKRALSIWWRIDSREDALKSIKWLKEEGHRKELDNLMGLYSNCTEEQFNKLFERFAYDQDLVNKLHFIRSYREQLKGKCIIGWDFCRLAGLAQDCYIAGYLNRDEAMGEIMNAAKVMQNNFSSWEEMANNHLLGREYWSGTRDERYAEAVKWLLTEQESPWVRYSWDLNLEKSN